MSLVKDGIFVKIDYTALVAEENIAFDTTIKEDAIKNDIFDEAKVYEPMLLVVGFAWLPKKVEEAMIGAKLNEEIEIQVSAEDAFGPRDPSRIKLVARREFQKMQINPQKGDYVKIDKKLGKVLSVSAGRVRVDFNHKLAGRDLLYRITIKQILDKPEEKIQAIIGRRLPGADLSDAIIEVTDDSIFVELPKRVTYFEYIQFAKQAIAIDIRDILKDYKLVRFIENFYLDDLDK